MEYLGIVNHNNNAFVHINNDPNPPGSTSWAGLMVTMVSCWIPRLGVSIHGRISTSDQDHPTMNPTSDSLLDLPIT